MHRAALGADGGFAGADEWHSTADEPDHQALCEREQAFLLRAIREDIDLFRHNEDAVRSLEIVLGADTSMREGRIVKL